MTVVEHLPPKVIMAKLAELEDEIQAGMKELDELLASTPLSQRESFCQSGTHSQSESLSGRAAQQSQTNFTAP